MNRGYLTPEEQPEDFGCIKVYYPNDLLYQAALLGSLSYLGTWTAWQRDEDKTGIIAGELWKAANELTLESLSEGCSGSDPDCDLCDMTEDDLREIISQELEKMSITNNVCVSCCNCGCSQTDFNDPEDPEFENPPLNEDPNPRGDDGFLPYEQEEQTESMCAALQYLLVDWRNMVLGIMNGSIGISQIRPYVERLYNGQFLPYVGVLAMIFEWRTFGAFPGGTDVSTVVAEIDARFEQLKCAILAGGTQSEIIQRAWNVIDAYAIGSATRYQLKKTIQPIPFEKLFIASSLNELVSRTPEQYYAAGCPDCVQYQSYPIPPVEYTGANNLRYVPADITAMAYEEPTATDQQMKWSFSNQEKVLSVRHSLASTSDYSTPGFIATWDTEEMLASEQVYGWIMELVDNDGDAVGVTHSGVTYDTREPGKLHGACYDSANRAVVQADFEGQELTWEPDLTSSFTRTTTTERNTQFEHNRPTSGSTDIDLKLRLWFILGPV